MPLFYKIEGILGNFRAVIVLSAVILMVVRLIVTRSFVGSFGF